MLISKQLTFYPPKSDENRKKKERKERKEIKTNKPKGVARGADPLAWCVMDSF